MEPINISTARQRLENAGLEKMDGAASPGFEIWLWPDGTPEMIPYADGTHQDFVKGAVDDILRAKPY